MGEFVLYGYDNKISIMTVSDQDQISEYLKAYEVQDKLTGRIKTSQVFLDSFDLLRVSWGWPIHPTSFCRSTEHNKAEDGHPNSLHLMDNPKHDTLGTIALDVTATSSFFRGMAWKLGWSIGHGKTFTHIDRRVDIGLRQTNFYY